MLVVLFVGVVDKEVDPVLPVLLPLLFRCVWGGEVDGGVVVPEKGLRLRRKVHRFFTPLGREDLPVESGREATWLSVSSEVYFS